MNTRIQLLSCDHCRRQLDVTNLEVGDEVQCVCDRVLVVGPPKEVTVRGHACGHCGGTISAADEDCSYCGAHLSPADRVETTICPVCATRLPNDSAHCKACGVELRAAAIPPIPRDGKCPRCDGKLRVHLTERAELIECSDGCGGIWCSRETFERLQRDSRRAAATGASDAPAEEIKTSLGAPAGAKRQYVPCPTCGDLMQRRMFRHEGRGSGIVLDVCRDHGVWFDADELQSALAFVRSSVRANAGLDGSLAAQRAFAEKRRAQGLDRRSFTDRPQRRQIGTAESLGAGIVEGLLEFLWFLPWL